MALDLRYVHKGLKICSSEINILSQKRTETLLKENKLILILDLDNTLLHTILSVDSLSLQAKSLLNSTKPNCLNHFFRWEDNVTKLRPFVHTFLKEASQMYDMYIYTLGCREYALQMAEFLDPEGIYFKSKIISREDCTRPEEKGLDIVLGEERAVVILDDNAFVWENYWRNLISIDRYKFSVLGEDESELDGVLATKLSVLKRVHEMFFNSDDFLNSNVRCALREIEKDDVCWVLLRELFKL